MRDPRPGSERLLVGSVRPDVLGRPYRTKLLGVLIITAVWLALVVVTRWLLGAAHREKLDLVAKPVWDGSEERGDKTRTRFRRSGVLSA